MGPRVFSILSLFYVLFALSIFANVFPSTVDEKENDQDADDQVWSKLKECSDFLAAVKKSSNSYRQCILDGFHNFFDNWTRVYDNEDRVLRVLSSAVKECVSIGQWQSLDIRRIKGPTKFAFDKDIFAIPLPPPPPHPSTIDSPPPAECTAIFHQIDGNIVGDAPDLNMSMELLKLAPGCRLHLAHPIDDRNFSTIGQVHPVIISKEIRSPCNVELHGRLIENVTTMNIHDFLATFDDQKPSFVDYLWMMDPWQIPVDDGSYGFDDRFQTYSLMLDGPPRDVTICQIMVSVPLSHYVPIGGLKRLLANVLEKSGFLPLRSVEATMPYFIPYDWIPRFLELYFNVADPYCVAKFIAPQFGVTSCGKKATIEGKEKVIKGQFEIDTELIRIE